MKYHSIPGVNLYFYYIIMEKILNDLNKKFIFLFFPTTIFVVLFDEVIGLEFEKVEIFAWKQCEKK